MKGGLISLYNINEEDLFLISNPEFSHFKIVYHRYSNFSTEEKEYLVPANFGKKIDFKIPYDGDLIYKMYLKIELPQLTQNIASIDMEMLKWKYWNQVEVPYVTQNISYVSVSNNITTIFLGKVLDVLESNIFKSIFTRFQKNEIFTYLNDIIILFESSDKLNVPKYLSNIVPKLLTFYNTSTQIQSSLASSNPVLADVLINFLINLYYILYKNINALYNVLIDAGIPYSSSDAFIAWNSEVNSLYTYLNIASAQYYELNNYYLTQIFGSYYTNTVKYIQSLDVSISIETGTSIEVVANSSTALIGSYNSYLQENLIALGYEYSFINAISMIAASNTNLITLQTTYERYNIPTNLINYYISKYSSTKQQYSTILYSLKYSLSFLQLFVDVTSQLIQIDTFLGDWINTNFSDLIQAVNTAISTNVNNPNGYISASLTRLLKSKLLFLEGKIDEFITYFTQCYNLSIVTSYISTINFTSIPIDQANLQISLYKNVVQIEDTVTQYVDINFVYYARTSGLLRQKTGTVLKPTALLNINAIIGKYIYLDNLPILLSRILDIISHKITDQQQNFIIEQILNYNKSVVRNIYQLISNEFVIPIDEFNTIIINPLDDISYLTTQLIHFVSSFTKTIQTSQSQYITNLITKNQTNQFDIIDTIAKYFKISSTRLINNFSTYPYYGTIDQFIGNTAKSAPIKDLVVLQSFLNDIFLEEIYYEYCLRKLLTIFNVFLTPLEANSKYKNWVNYLQQLAITYKLTSYESQVLLSYHYFNFHEIALKIKKTALLTYLQTQYDKTLWTEKLYFFNILNEIQFKEYTRVNTTQYTNAYNDWLRKVNGNKKWMPEMQIVTLYDLSMTVVEAHYTRINLENIYLTFSKSNTYNIYLTNIQNQYNSQYSILINKLINSQINQKPRITVNMKEGNLATFPIGRQYAPIHPVNILLEPLTVFIGYKTNLFANEIVRLENSTKQIKQFKDNFSPIHSFIVLDYTENTLFYKDYIPLDRLYIVNNDIKLDFENKTLTRIIPEENNVYLYFEALRWYTYGDYLFLTHFTSPKFSSYLYWDKLVNTNPFSWVENIGHQLINKSYFLIGDQIIDQVNAEWLSILQQYFRRRNRDYGYNNMIGNISVLTTLSTNIDSYILYIPLPLWFSKSNETALPIISLTNTTVSLKIQLESLQNLIVNFNDNINVNSKLKASIIINYVYLDLTERLKFIQNKHFYILNNLKVIDYLNIEPNMCKFGLDFPVIDLFFVFKDKKTGNILDIIDKFQLVINGKPMNQITDSIYYKWITPNNLYYTAIPGVICYSFAVYPLEIQPSGSLNFAYVINSFITYSFIDPSINYMDISLTIYAREYNVLQIQSGQGALLFN